MLRSTFRYFQPASLFIILPVLLIVLWLPQLINPTQWSNDYGMPLFFLLDELNQISPLTGTITALIMVFAQAIFLNSIINKYEIFTQRTSMTALVFALAVSSLPGLRSLHPVHPAGILVLASLYRLFTVYRQHTAYSQVFDAGALIALASLFYLPCILLFPVIWIFLIIMRPFIWREYLLALAGFILPYLFIFTIYYMFDSLDYLLKDVMLKPFQERIYYYFVSDKILQVLLFFMVFLLLVSIPSFLSLIGKTTVRSQNLQFVVTWLFLVSIAAVVQTGVNVPADYAFVAIPYSIPLAHFFISIRRGWLAEFFILSWLGLILFQAWYV